jgi:hypothetical protein
MIFEVTFILDQNASLLEVHSQFDPFKTDLIALSKLLFISISEDGFTLRLVFSVDSESELIHYIDKIPYANAGIFDYVKLSSIEYHTALMPKFLN